MKTTISRSKSFRILLLLLFPLNIWAQNFMDSIYSKSGDTILCNITLVNDQNNFYQYKKKRSIRNDVISLSNVIDFFPKTDVLEKPKKIKEPLVYYGIDFSKFKINDYKRKNQNIQLFIYKWLDIANETMGQENYLSSLLKADTIIYDQIYTTELLKSLSSHDLVSVYDNKIKSDSIPLMINNIGVNNEYNYGFVVIIENLSEPNKSVSGYFVYFNNMTKEILQMNHFEKAGLIYSFNRVQQWGDAIKEVIIGELKQMKIEF